MRTLRTPSLVLLAILPACGDGGGRDPRPNVVLCVVDTLRADHMSLYGYERPTTPNVDAWAAGGTVFDHASSASSWTLPSMAMLLTGVYRVQNYGKLGPEDHPFSESFRAAGYRTAAVVCNDLLGTQSRADGSSYDPDFRRGFDQYTVLPQRRDGLANGPYAEELVERGVSWMSSLEDGQPFLLWLHFFDPHAPRRPANPTLFRPQGSEEREARIRQALPPGERDALSPEGYAYIEREIALYDCEVGGFDRAMGQLIDWLEASGRSENTLVLLTSDHGEGLWQRRQLPGEKPRKDNRVPGLYSDHGTMLHQEQIHVPLIIRGPGVPSGQRIDTPVSLVDVVPTLLSLADVNGPGTTDGLNLFGDLSGRSQIYSICSRGTSITVDGRWRLHLPADYRVKRDDAGPEFYDLRTDPGETGPLEDPERIESLTARIRDFHRTHDTFTALPDEEAAARRKLLDAMGYTGQ